ncbi:NACHT domain-containing protein [uncultured Nostoc sp.]|uniref:NACHT domain-containing protein n=1 Tax=uncultured Nostoc sp. TaxID=340711 RepID=UPI0035CB2C95
MIFKELIGQLPKIIDVLGQVRTQAQNYPKLIEELQKWGLDPTQPPDKPDAIYAWSIVKYYDKSQQKQLMINLLGEDEIKKTFLENFNANDLPNFLKQAKDFIVGRGLPAEFREKKVDLRPEIQDFSRIYTKVAKWTRPVLEVLSDAEFSDLPEYSDYPKEFQALIQKKIESFCGREFVFQQIQQFIYRNSNGYFTIVGDAGMGKSTIAAKYVSDKKFPCYFNIRAEGRNRPELFLDSLRQQLINRYWLQNAKDDNLQTLLQKVSDNLLDDERIVIVVDALDEVEKKYGDENILNLPTTLPNKVYFLLTRRPYIENNKRLYIQGVPEEELDLRSQEYGDLSRQDIENYIWFFVQENPKTKDSLSKWIQEREKAPLTFVNEIAERSENNFMYLYHLLPGIAKGEYNDVPLEKFPKGLQEYYQTHWRRMGMDTQNNDKETKDKKTRDRMVFILFIFVQISSPISCEMIAEIAGQDKYDVQKVLDEWIEYLKPQEKNREIRYSIYHTSFLDFLKRKRDLDKNQTLLAEIKQRIVEYFDKKMESDGRA